jgi:hypothetical protein
MLYQAYQAHADFMLPIRALAGGSAQVISLAPLGLPDNAASRNLTAAYELIARSGSRIRARPTASTPSWWETATSRCRKSRWW